MYLIHQREKPFSFAGAGWSHAQIGQGKERRAGDFAQKVGRQVAIERHEARVGGVSASEPSIGQRSKDALTCRLQRMRVSNCRNQPVRPFDSHIDIGRQILGAIDKLAHKPHPPGFGDQFLALGIAADGGEDRGRQAKSAQRHGDVHRHTSGKAGDPPRHIGPGLHMHSGAADHIPKDGTDTEDVGCLAHTCLLPQSVGACKKNGKYCRGRGLAPPITCVYRAATSIPQAGAGAMGRHPIPSTGWAKA